MVEEEVIVVSYIFFVVTMIFIIYGVINEIKCSREHKAFMNNIKTKPRRRFNTNVLISSVRECNYINKGIAELQHFANNCNSDGEPEDWYTGE